MSSTAEFSSILIADLSGDFAVRRGVDEEHVHRLNQSADPLPPILVHHSTRRVIDGVHRLRAAALCGRTEIEVEFFHGDEEAALIKAVEENTRHGLPLSLADRKAAAMRIIATRQDWSDRAIAQRTGLSDKTVAGLRRRSTSESPESNARTGLDGRTRPVNGADGRRRAAQMVALRPDATLREIAQAAGVSVGTAHDVRRRLRHGQDPVPAGLRRIGGEAPQSPHGPPDEVREQACREHVALDQYEPPRGDASGNGASTASLAILLDGLTRDPSLRQSELGRRLLKLLITRSITVEDWHILLSAIPPHRVRTVAMIARQYAENWDLLARTLESRRNPSA